MLTLYNESGRIYLLQNANHFAKFITHEFNPLYDILVPITWSEYP